MCTTVLAPGPQRPMKQARQRGTPSTTMCTPCATASAQLRHVAAASVAACAASRLSWRACTRAVSSAMRAAAVAAETSAPPPPAKVAGRRRRIRVVAQITRGGRNGTRERRKGHERRAVRVGGGMECGRELRTACIFVAAHRSGAVVCSLTCKCAGRMRRITFVARITAPMRDERHMSDAPFECAAGRSAGGRDVQAASSLMAAEVSSCTGASAMNCKWELQVGEAACIEAQHDRR